MVSELRVRNTSQSQFVAALSALYLNGIQLYDPSMWLSRDPEVEERMLRDADIAHAVGHRQRLVAGKQWSMQSESDAPIAQLANHVGTQLLKSIKHFTTARQQLARAFLSGQRFARIVGEPRTLTLGDGRPRTWWVPTQLVDMDKRMFRTVPIVAKGVVSKRYEQWSIGRRQWEPMSVDDARCTIRHTYQDDQTSLGYGRGLREALGWWWFAKTEVFQESLQAVERFAQGILSAKIDGARDATTGLPNQEIIRQWTAVLQDLRSRHVLVYDANDQVEHIQMGGEGWQLLSEIRAELKSTITELILGANLPTGADSGGSYALANVQQDSTEAIVQFDREAMEETLNDDLVRCVWERNWPNLVELRIEKFPPRFTLVQDKVMDPEKRANVAATLSGIGLPLSKRDLYDQTGFKQPEPGEDVLTPPAPPDPFGGFGGGFGGAPSGGAPEADAGGEGGAQQPSAGREAPTGADGGRPDPFTRGATHGASAPIQRGATHGASAPLRRTGVGAS